MRPTTVFFCQCGAAPLRPAPAACPALPARPLESKAGRDAAGWRRRCHRHPAVPGLPAALRHPDSQAGQRREGAAQGPVSGAHSCCRRRSWRASWARAPLCRCCWRPSGDDGAPNWRLQAPHARQPGRGDITGASAPASRPAGLNHPDIDSVIFQHLGPLHSKNAALDWSAANERRRWRKGQSLHSPSGWLGPSQLTNIHACTSVQP